MVELHVEYRTGMKSIRKKLSSYLEVPALSDFGEHDICQTRKEGLADVNKDL